MPKLHQAMWFAHVVKHKDLTRHANEMEVTKNNTRMDQGAIGRKF